MVVTSFAEDYTMTVKNALGRTETNGGQLPVGVVVDRRGAQPQRVDGGHRPAGGVVNRAGPLEQRIDLGQQAVGNVVDRSRPETERVDAGAGRRALVSLTGPYLDRFTKRMKRMKRKPATMAGRPCPPTLPLADRVFLLGFCTLSAKPTDRSELPLN
jgi:hypothetical protein